MINLNSAINIVEALGALIVRQGGIAGDSIELNHCNLIQYFDCNPQIIEEALKYVSSKNIVVGGYNINYDVRVTVVGDSYIIKLV